MTMSVYDGSTLMHLPYFSPPFCLNVFCCHSSQTQSSRITFSSLLFRCVLSFRQSQYGLWLLHRSERSAHQSFAIPQDYPKVLCCVKRMLTSSLKLCCPWRELWTSYFKIWCIKAFVHTQCIEASTSKLIIHGYLLKRKNICACTTPCMQCCKIHCNYETNIQANITTKSSCIQTGHTKDRARSVAEVTRKHQQLQPWSYWIAVE